MDGVSKNPKNKMAVFRKSLPFQELGLVPQHQKRCPETFRKQHR